MKKFQGQNQKLPLNLRNESVLCAEMSLRLNGKTTLSVKPAGKQKYIRKVYQTKVSTTDTLVWRAIYNLQKSSQILIHT